MIPFAHEAKHIRNEVASFSKEQQRIHELRSSDSLAGFAGKCFFGRWEAGYWNTHLGDISLFTKKFENQRAARKIQSFNSTLGDAVLAFFHGRKESLQCESTLPNLQHFHEVNNYNANGFSAPPLSTADDILLAHYIPVYVMLPLDMISNDNVLTNVDLLHSHLWALKAAHVDGVMVDVWWGIVEKSRPKQYDWSAYRALFQIIKNHGFKLQVVMSFHECGGNVGDTCHIQLPDWICKQGESDHDIFFTDRDGRRNKEYLSLGIDDRRVLNGRSAVEVYSDFMQSFRDSMQDFLEAEMITEVEVGLGPSGELRYPSFRESHGWHFPGIGEFQCYDKYLLSDLQQAATNIGRKEWGYSGPKDAGHYNDWPWSTGFFCNHGSFSTDYGRFFLEWYSNVLLKHGDRVLEEASDVFVGCKVKLAAKIAGIHWWYNSRSHAAELAAGYYNLRDRDGYMPILKMLARHRATLNFTCSEMRDDEHYWEFRCGPEGLVRQVFNAGWNEGIDVSSENALPRYDRTAFDQIVKNARPDGISKVHPPKKRILSFTYLRLSQYLMQENNWREFNLFVRHMHAGLDYHPEPEKYFHPRVPLEHRKPVEALPKEPVLPAASRLLDHHFVPPKKRKGFFFLDSPGEGLCVLLREVSARFPFNLASWPWGRERAREPQSEEIDNVSMIDDSIRNDKFPEFLGRRENALKIKADRFPMDWYNEDDSWGDFEEHSESNPNS